MKNLLGWCYGQMLKSFYSLEDLRQNETNKNILRDTRCKTNKVQLVIIPGGKSPDGGIPMPGLYSSPGAPMPDL